MSVLGLLAKGAKAKPLRSTLDEAVEALARPKGTGAEFLREIEKTKGVKPTEIKERGIDKVLANMPKVNKEEIVKAIQSKANPSIEEKILGSGEHRELYPTESKHLKEMIEAHNSGELDPYQYNYMVDLLNRSEKSTNHSLSQTVNDVNARMLEAKANGQKRLFNQLSDEMEVLYDRQQRLNGVLEDNTRYGEYALPNGQNYREILLKLPKGEGDEFTSGHFSEPNILAHMRVSDRSGPNGEKVLHLEELQSDWHQKGREHGYKPPYKKTERTETNPYGFGTIHDTNLVPDAPFKKNWHEVALKKLINYATENGYDRLAITPGSEQAKRYSLAKHINELHLSGTNLVAYDHNGKEVIKRTGIWPEDLPELIGKEATEKLLAQQPQGTLRSLTGQNLEVGGEGMKGFYDKMLPDYLNKLGSPHGAQVKMHGMPSSPQLASEFNNMLDHADLTPEMFKALPVEQQQKITSDWTQKTSPSLHTFDLTPSLKNEVTQKGLPLYQQIGIPLGGAEAVNLAQPEPEMKRGGSVSISNNPDTMFMELADKKMKGGGAEDDTKLTPSQWLKAQANKPTEPFTPIEDLTANLKAIANFPSKMYEGAKQLVTDPRAYFADMKAPTAEELAMAFNPAGVGMMGATKGIPTKFDRAPPLTKAEITKLLAETPELAHTVRGLYKAEAPELSGLIDKVQTPNRQSVIPMPNRWFTKPKENPHVQPLVEKVLQVNNMKREDFHSGAFVDPKTGLILDNQIHNDVGVAINPITNRPVMTSGGVTGMESLPRDQGSFTNSNLLKQGKYKPTGGDSILNELGFIATVDKAGMGHAYGLGTDYASPVLLNNLGTGSNPTLRPRSVGDVFGVGDVVGQMQINKNSPVHDVYEKLLVAPKGSDVEGVKLSKAKGGAIRKMASGGAVQNLETNLPALTKTDYHSIDKLMAHISKEHKIPPQKLHDDFVAKHHMTPDTWIKRK